jgi:hypothetical protein
MSDMMKKLMMPMDARSGRGVFSRGKPVYKGGTNSPKSRDRIRGIPMTQANKERMAGFKQMKVNPPKPKRISPLQMAAKKRLSARVRVPGNPGGK